MYKAKHLIKNNNKIILWIISAFSIILLLQAITFLHSWNVMDAVAQEAQEKHTENASASTNNNKNEFVPNIKPFDFEKLITVHNDTVHNENANLPAAWNSEKLGLVPNKVRNQGQYGTCWDFAAMCALESSAITRGLSQKGRNIDLSERQNVFFISNNKDLPDHLDLITKDYNEHIDKKDITKEKCESYLDTGGYAVWAAMPLFTWCGPTDETLAPYDVLSNWKAKEDLTNIAFVNRLLLYGPDGERGWKAKGYKQTWEEMNKIFLNLLKNYNLDKDLAFDKDSYHLQDYNMIPYLDDKKSYNINAIKDAVTKNGAVTCDYYETQSEEYNEEHNSYNCTDAQEANHAVAIVGWDDNFSKDNFNKKPSGNGAWLVRNSWGTEDQSGDYNHRGYFWISYYNATFTLPNEYFCTFVPELSNNYDNNYQYDGNIDINTLETNTDASCVANEFCTKAIKDGCEELSAVALGVINQNTNFDLQIYKDINNPADPTSGTPCFAQPQHVHFDWGGYHTVKLEQPIYLDENTNYSVVFTCTDKDGRSNLFVSRSGDYDTFHLHEYTLPNQSFMLHNNTWKDMHNDNSCFRIKAYTNNKIKVSYTGEISNTIYVDPHTRINLPVCPEKNYKYIFTVDGKKITDTSIEANKNIEIEVTKEYVGSGGEVTPANYEPKNGAQTGDNNLDLIALLAIISTICSTLIIARQTHKAFK